jgi:tetratricopeptide (TPR) repeat protein
MPAAARAAVISQAQGIPLFAVETIRSLIDRDIVQPVEGEYRLVDEVGDLQVPDSLHALLAARLDALDSGVRWLLADAAVLGTTFPAEALVAVSGQDSAIVRAALAELVRREVLRVSADPLSPERGSYQFAQEMLRQVAYDTLSRRDRKNRHLKVAAHLRAAFPGDGEEVTDVIARHYLDALHAVPDDPDSGPIRNQAIIAVARAAERAQRTGALGLAATNYATAAELTQTSTPDGHQAAGGLWERAAEAAATNGDYTAAIGYSAHSRQHYRRGGETRAAARAQAIAGRALRLRGRHSEAREQLTTAVEVLRAAPDADTVRAMQELATVEVFAGSPEADKATTEALILGQALDVDASQLAGVFLCRGSYHAAAARRPQSVAYFREAARLAEQAGDNMLLGRVLLNLSDSLAVADPAAGAAAARTAAGHLRQAGDRDSLVFAITNHVQALLMLGDWDTAADVLTQARDADGLANVDHLALFRGWLAAMRGDTATAESQLGELTGLRTSEDPQDRAWVSLVEAFTAAARRQPADTLRHVRDTLAYADALGISHECLRWGWPLAARAAHQLRDDATTTELLTLLGSYPRGHLAPMLRAERGLVRARLADDRDDPDTAAFFTAAVADLREHSTPYHLAYGLLDHAEWLTRSGDGPARLAAVEAREIGHQLRCQPLVDQAADQTPATGRSRA